MKISKYGFTLVELIITLTIIGVLAVTALSILSPMQAVNREKLEYRYAAAYLALNKAASSLIGDDQSNPFTGSKQLDAEGNVITDGEGNEQYNDDYFELLCNGMVDLFHNKGNSCTSALSDDIAFAKSDSTDFSNITANIHTLNNMKIYISDRYMYDNGNDVKFPFFMIYVDLNVKDGKNHAIAYDFDKNIFPDVFAFAFVPTGNIIPIGIAEYNRMLLPVKVEYVSNNKLQYTSEKYSYHQAKHLAWGWYSSSNNGVEFKDFSPYTYNDFIRNFLEENQSVLYEDLENITYNTPILNECSSGGGAVYDKCNIRVFPPKEFY